MSGPSVGVVFRPQSPPEQLPAVVDAAERAGVAELWLWEDCFLAGGLSTAAVALARSERLHVGVGLLPVPLRNPALAAMEIATLARLFPGRFRPALGHGVLDWMGQVGARADSPMTLLAEYTGAVRALLRGEQVDVAGEYVRLDRVALDGPPREVPPVLVGARGPRTLRLSGRLADGVVLDAGLDTDDVRDALLETSADRPRDAGAFHVVCYVAVGSHTSDLAHWTSATAAAYGEAGADSVVFVPPAGDPDPTRLIEAIGRPGAG
ncbi:LLM class flavin-dependent oxidoreductase [Pseudonocardia sp. KRD291]|uniref:LLM class flavin-dependent oxidoreductase n=1 Tax=Pseudonocardia sp. KRD291 TaxID=2792007 RepID=UPI001C49F216|nr:LLM class flavin-dependent oxidoreductase [Pseudonocardia sp. KRD291]MBW0106946.1 LLM class flavin-dependent oxidoreductase [Pseudonocardia sp. KRD291]